MARRQRSWVSASARWGDHPKNARFCDDWTAPIDRGATDSTPAGSSPCFLTDKSYRNGIVSSRMNVTGMGALCKRQIGSLWLRDGLEEHLLDVIDLRAQGNKV
jgi:hypothetical protein